MQAQINADKVKNICHGNTRKHTETHGKEHVQYPFTSRNQSGVLPSLPEEGGTEGDGVVGA